MNPLLIGLVVVLLVLLAYLWMHQRGDSAKAETEEDRLDTIIGWPPQATRVMTSQERALHSTLTRALPDHLILPQVPLARFIKVPKRNSYAEWLRRLGYQSVDFVVCDMSSHVIAAIELHAPGAEMNDRARKRLKRIQRTLKAADITLHVWNEASLPTPDAARAAIIAKPATAGTEDSPAAAAAANRGVPTLSTRQATKANPFDEQDRDSTQDELIEAPPSTWFDDLDSGPAPLAAPQKPTPTKPRH